MFEQFPEEKHLYEQALEDDCFRTCIGYIFDIHPSEIPYVHPEAYNFWTHHEDWLTDNLGVRHVTTYNYNQLLEQDKLWIAIVPTIPASKEIHAIVMKGEKLEFDPAYPPRSTKPKKFIAGITFEAA